MILVQTATMSYNFQAIKQSGSSSIFSKFAELKKAQKSCVQLCALVTGHWSQG